VDSAPTPALNGFAWWPTRRGAIFDLVLALCMAILPVLLWLLSMWLLRELPSLTKPQQPQLPSPAVTTAGLLKQLGEALIALSLIARRRLPAVVALVTIVATGLNFGSPLALMVAMYTLAAYGDSRRALVGLSVLAAIAELKPWNWLDLANVAQYLVIGVTVASASLTVVLPVVLGLYLSARRSLLATLRERADRLEREQFLLAQQVRAEERTRIAREMHDVVAHRVSLMVVHAGALEMAPGKGPDKVAESAVRIGDAGRQALGELREIVGVLKVGGTGDAAPLAPQPTLDDLTDLVEQSRGAGVPVAMRVEGQRRRLANVTERTAYRIVQEGLTNVHKHAGGARTEISLRFLPGRLEVSVLNDAPRGPAELNLPSGGHGLAGLRERLTLVGGEFESGPSGSGGFLITARIPTAVPAR
jgi:signal transduction histidine kinase